MAVYDCVGDFRGKFTLKPWNKPGAHKRFVSGNDNFALRDRIAAPGMRREGQGEAGGRPGSWTCYEESSCGREFSLTQYEFPLTVRAFPLTRNELSLTVHAATLTGRVAPFTGSVLSSSILESPASGYAFSLPASAAVGYTCEEARTINSLLSQIDDTRRHSLVTKE